MNRADSEQFAVRRDSGHADITGENSGAVPRPPWAMMARDDEFFFP